MRVPLFLATSIFSLILIFGWQGSSYSATTVTFGDNTVEDFPGTVEDALIFERDGRRNYNYGNWQNIGVGEVSDLTWTRRMLVRFRDIATNIGAGKQIVSATMFVYCSFENSSNDYSVSAYRVLLDWAEGNSDGVTEQGAVCWNAAQYNALLWNVAGCNSASDVPGEDSTADRRATAEDSTLITRNGQYFSWDVTEAVRNWYNGNWSEYGFILINDSEGTIDSRKTFLATHTDTVDGQRPYLSVTYDDESVYTHYVWSGGSNQSPYTSWSTAAHSIQDAIDVSAVGHTVMARVGAYYESITMKDGVDVINNPGDTPMIVGGGTNPVLTFSGTFSTGCTLNGFDILNGGTNGGIYLQPIGTGMTNSTSIKNCSIHANNGPGIKLDGTNAITAPTIDNNDIYNNSQEGIHIIQGGSSVEDVIITNNDIHGHISGSGINIGGDSYVTIGDNNDIYGNYAGIAFDTAVLSSQPITIIGNNIYSNSHGGIYVRDAITGQVTITQNDVYQNTMGGIGIQNACDLVVTKNDIRDNGRGGLHTGTDVSDGGGFYGSLGSAILTIRQNKVHNNGGSNYGGGIDVRHASGTIENNLVYKNHRGGIRFGWENETDDHVTDIKNNTVVSNGNASDDKGGGIIYDDLAGAVNDEPSGDPPAPLNISNNIAVYNQKAGIKTCFTNTEDSEERDYNLVYANNGTGETDCGWPDNLIMSCTNKQFGGCGGKSNPTPPPNIILDGPHHIIADPWFKDMANDDYRLQRVSEGDANDSPAIGAGASGVDVGAYGGSYPIDW